jgi:hypothetical protein
MTMSKHPVFVLSLDCEGLWGMLDQPELIQSGKINAFSLDKAYESISKILVSNGIRCTAAFVSAFAAPWDLLEDCRELIQLQIDENPEWFNAIRESIYVDRDFHSQGFDGSRFFKWMKSDGHEMAWHGSTHVSWDDNTPSRSIGREIDIFRKINAELGVSPTTMIFPRNVSGHLAELKIAGIDSYRAGEKPAVGTRILNLCKEFSSYNASSSQQPIFQDGLWIHPKGDFLNWACGIRRLIPAEISWMRWKAMIDNAIESGGYVHMWFHPHNVITCPEMLSLFKRIMEYLGSLISSGYMRNLTMNEHSLIINNN